MIAPSIRHEVGILSLDDSDCREAVARPNTDIAEDMKHNKKKPSGVDEVKGMHCIATKAYEHTPWR